MKDIKEVFGEFTQDKAEKYSREEYSVYEWVGKRLHKKTYTRRYYPKSTNGYSDEYKSEQL